MTGQEFGSLGKLSQVIAVGIEDGRRVIGDPRYAVTHAYFHEASDVITEPHSPLCGKCAVCFAGAVMAGTLGAAISKSLVPKSFARSAYPGVEGRLLALESVRSGDLTLAVKQVMRDPKPLTHPLWQELRNYPVSDGRAFYDEQKFAVFLGDMEKLVAWLEERGL